MLRNLLVVLVSLLLPLAPVAAEVALSDDGVSISKEELELIISRWEPQMRRAAANNVGERLELLNAALTTRKMAAELDALTPEEDGEEYWQLHNKLLGFKRQYRLDRFLKTLEYPEFEDLARERYTTEKDKYAKVPEKRLSSHILFKCFPGECDRAPLRPKAAAVLEELRNGADFEALVEEYSEDPGSKAKGGRFDRWMQIGELGVLPKYSGGVFSIEKIGDYSDVVDSRFGLHIIRLDDVRPEHYLPYEEVHDTIVDDLRKEYQKLSLKEFQAQYRIGEDAFIDGDILDGLLAPYKTK